MGLLTVASVERGSILLESSIVPVFDVTEVAARNGTPRAASEQGRLRTARASWTRSRGRFVVLGGPIGDGDVSCHRRAADEQGGRGAFRTDSWLPAGIIESSIEPWTIARRSKIRSSGGMTASGERLKK